MSLDVLIAIVATGLLVGEEPVSNGELYAVLGLVSGLVGAALLFLLFRILGMHFVVREGRAFLVGGLAGADTESRRKHLQDERS
jgi:hypothetical protein